MQIIFDIQSFWNIYFIPFFPVYDMSWYGNHSTLSRLVPPARLGIYRKMEPQQRAHLKCQLVHARVCKVIFQSSSESGSENENENATQLNRTELN